MAEIHKLPGMFAHALEQHVEPETVLHSALDAGLRDVAIVGRAINGNLIVFSSHANNDATIGLLVRGTNWLAEAQQVAEPD